MLIALILFGVAVIAVAAAALVRSSWATEARRTRNLRSDPKQVEKEVYEKLYGERSIRPIASKPPLKDPRTRTRRSKARRS